MAVDSPSFRAIAEYVHAVTGIVLEPGKEYLVENRLGPILRTEGLSYAELVRKAHSDLSGVTRTTIIDALTTNETSFMRDGKPFQLFGRRLLPELVQQGTPSSRPLRIWSAACSTGQEPYSISMVSKEYLGNLAPGRLQILATDISQTALRIAQAGVYNRAEVSRGLSPARLQAHFQASDQGWQIVQDLRRAVNYQQVNLQKPFDHIGIQDVVFCRNVAIYFSLEDRNRLFSRIGNVLRKDGILVVGATESLLEVRNIFTREEVDGVVFYRRK